MKKILILFAMMTMILSGCGKGEGASSEKVELSEDEIKELEVYNDTFTDLRLESELEWYNDYIAPLKENSWKVSKIEIESILDDVKEKRDSVNSIKKDEVEKYLNYKYEKVTRNGEDKELRNKIDKEIEKLPTSLKGMNEILDIIENDLKLGLDERFSNDDKNKIENSFAEIVKIYEDKIQ